MIEPIVDRLERGLHIGEIHDPAGVRIDGAAQVQLDAKRMAMQARALVAGRDVRQAMGGFDGEDSENVHDMKKGAAVRRLL